MLVSDAHRMAFVHVQKTGGVTVGRMLEASLPDLRQVPAAGVKHYTLAQGLAEEPDLAAYWTFGFVRNPWARMVSWWSMVQKFKEDAAEGSERKQAHFQRNGFLRAVREYPDFDTFVRQGPEEFERLRTPQVTYLEAGDRSVDFVGRTEALENDVAKVFEHLGVPQPDKVPHVNKSPHAHYTTYYSAASRQRVAELFAPDLEAFDYEFGAP
jgi:Sulfotransferase family